VKYDKWQDRVKGMSVTKAKVNWKEGIIELEGSEAFVMKYLETFQEQLKSVKLETNAEQVSISKETDDNNSDTSKQAKIPKKKISKLPLSVAPIPIDLTAKGGNPSLKQFFSEKLPTNAQEYTTVFAYYLKHYLGINEMKAGHVVACCRDVDKPVPTNLRSLFLNAQHRKGWLDVGAGSESVQITIAGENFVQYELPHKHAKEDKKAA
jgi:hypothetical protein